jgi:hypothetical protein
MSNGELPGPEVDPKEDLYRCITTPDWWVSEASRPSSAAFKQPDFSTDMASIARSPEYTLRRFPPGCGLVSFNYAEAKKIGFVARIEPDPDYPDNHAHANVYNSATSGNARKKMAQKLVETIMKNGGVLVPPSFA